MRKLVSSDQFSVRVACIGDGNWSVFGCLKVDSEVVVFIMDRNGDVASASPVSNKPENLTGVVGGTFFIFNGVFRLTQANGVASWYVL